MEVGIVTVIIVMDYTTHTVVEMHTDIIAAHMTSSMEDDL